LAIDDGTSLIGHEFGHKLGLSHRSGQGIADYPKTGGGYKLIESDVNRLRSLYEK
jgi:predicted Zn-dependent protease